MSLTEQRELEELYRNFPKCSKLIYLETVISGLTSHTILKGFNDADYKPYTIFVVDSYGAKLKPKYSWIFRSLELNGLATKILVSKLIAKDTKSALLGVSATVYPTIIMASWKKIKPCGAVEWHLAIGKHLEVFIKLQTCLRKSLEGKEFTSEVEKINESLNSIKGEEIPQLGLRTERIEETRGGVANIYLTLKDSNLVEWCGSFKLVVCQIYIKGDLMYLDDFKARLVKEWSGSLFSLSSIRKIHPRAKEYLHRLSKSNGIRRVTWGWYWIPTSYRDAWEFLAKDRGFKVIIKQTAASIWNYDFVHRDVFRLAVNSQSYKKALEAFAKSMGWDFEVEYHKKIPYEYEKVDGLFIETLESCIVDCLAEWSFIDAFATLYLRREEVDFDKLRNLGRWKRVSKTNLRAWTLIKYGCKLFNEHFGREVFKFKVAEVKQADVRELVNEAVEKVVEFA